MKQTKNFNINVPELGDKPDITQVSDAIQALEDALAGTLEVMNASIQGSKLTLTSGARTTARTKYYEGMAIKFVAPIQINPNSITTASVDGLSDQTLEIPYLVNVGDSVDIIYKDNKFTGTISAVQRTSAVDSSSETTVATSLAVKKAYDKGVDGVNKANKAQETADSKISRLGDTVPGVLTFTNTGDNIKFSDKCAIYSTNNAIGMLKKDGMCSWSMNKETGVVQYVSTPNVAGNNIYHEGNKPSASDIGAVGKSGDTMTGSLNINLNTNTHGILVNNLGGTVSYYLGAINNENVYYVGKGSPDSDDIALHSYKLDTTIKLRANDAWFNKGITISASGGSIRINKGADDVYLFNSVSGRYLQMKDNGTLMHSGAEIWDKRNTFIVLPDGLPTLDSIKNLKQGIYRIVNKPVYGLGTGYFTVVRITDQSRTGDTHCVVYPDGNSDKFHKMGFNSGNWNGSWNTFYSDKSSAYHANLTLTGGHLYSTASGFGVVGQIANLGTDHLAYELRSRQGSVGFGVTTSGNVQFWNGSGNGENGSGKSAFMHISGSQSVSFPGSITTSGSVAASGNISAYSDIKLKEDLEIIPDAIEKIKALNGYTYTRKDSGERQTGVVAQEVQKVLPEAVSCNKEEDGDETLSVAYGNMVGLLIEGIKEQQKKIDFLEERLARLEKLLEGR